MLFPTRHSTESWNHRMLEADENWRALSSIPSTTQQSSKHQEFHVMNLGESPRNSLRLEIQVYLFIVKSATQHHCLQENFN